MAKSLFPLEMLNNASEELTIESVASNLSFFYEQIHLLHWQTHSYTEHKSLGTLYTYIEEFKDDIMEKIMGYTGQRPKVFKINPMVTYSAEMPVQITKDVAEFAKKLKRYGQVNDMVAICNMADELSGKTAKILYLLTLT